MKVLSTLSPNSASFELAINSACTEAVEGTNIWLQESVLEQCAEELIHIDLCEEATSQVESLQSC